MYIKLLEYHFYDYKVREKLYTIINIRTVTKKCEVCETNLAH